MKIKIMSFLLVALIAGTAVTQAEPIDYEGVVAVDTVKVAPGDVFGVKVWLRNNDIDISAIFMPLKFSSPYLTLDSVSAVNTVWNSDFSFHASIDDVAQTVRISVLPADVEYPLPSASFVDGVIAELFFSASASATAQRVEIDSVYYDTVVSGGTHVTTQLEISNNAGVGVYLPGFVPGEIQLSGSTSVDTETGQTGLPTRFELAQNYPNPFNPVTVITFSLPRSSQVSLDVFNILGQHLMGLADGVMSAGTHQVEFDGGNLPSGIYFYRLCYGEGTLTRKMVLVK